MSSSFDRLAPTYDHDFTEGVIARHLRNRAHARLNMHFHRGDTVLELGCGTGEDARAAARRGIRVIATDASPEMLKMAQAKTADLPLVTLESLDLNALSAQFPPVDHAFSNFGAINCVHDRRALACWLADRVRPGGKIVFGIMSPLCLWEIGWHVLHADFKIAFRRLHKYSEFQIDGGDMIRVYYPTIQQISAEFSPYFRRIHVEPLGLLLPPTALYPVLEKRPRLLSRLTRLDDAIRASALSMLADHYWIEFERNA